MRLMPGQVHYTGSMYEGIPLEVCSDQDVMFTDPTYPVVLLEPPGDSNNTSHGLRIMGS